MTTAYLETSALVSLVIDEPGSDDVSSVWAASTTAITGRLTYPEARAAFAAAERAGRLTGRQHGAAIGGFHRLWDSLAVVELAPRIASHAGELAARRALRGYDAVHLAAALEVMDAGGVLVTFDRQLAIAALAEGLSVAPAG